MGYRIKLNQFEGPFDLLVYLIEHAQMNIYDIRVCEITAQYVDCIEEMKRQDISVGSEFMVLAAMLIELKSRMLLPRRPKEEASEPEDPRKELVQRLLEYKKFREAARLLQHQEEAMLEVYSKPQEDLSEYEGEPKEVLNMDFNQFVRAFRQLLIRTRRLEEVKKTYAKIERERVSVEHRIQEIQDCLIEKKKLTFQELLTEDSSRYDVVVTFMSVLELLKQRVVTASQKARYGKITIVLTEKAGQEPLGREK